MTTQAQNLSEDTRAFPSPNPTAPRTVSRIVTAHRQTEGGGFVVRRPIPSESLSLLDPFLLLDEMGPVDYAPGKAIGAPDHPHRGFETVTYLLQGEMEHQDSAGHRGILRPGDVQWMTAGSGVVHSEMPSEHLLQTGGMMHGFQIWVNLPSSLKMVRPRYQEVANQDIPMATAPNGLAQVRVIAGAALGVEAVIATHTPIVFQDWTIHPGGSASLDLAPDHQVGVYVFSGNLLLGPDNRLVTDGQLAVLSEGRTVRMVVAPGETGPARVLLLAGIPHGEPVARYGPFVMNTQEELHQAIADFRNGRMGHL